MGFPVFLAFPYFAPLATALQILRAITFIAVVLEQRPKNMGSVPPVFGPAPLLLLRCQAVVEAVDEGEDFCDGAVEFFGDFGVDVEL